MLRNVINFGCCTCHSELEAVDGQAVDGGNTGIAEGACKMHSSTKWVSTQICWMPCNGMNPLHTPENQMVEAQQQCPMQHPSKGFFKCTSCKNVICNTRLVLMQSQLLTLPPQLCQQMFKLLLASCLVYSHKESKRQAKLLEKLLFPVASAT